MEGGFIFAMVTPSGVARGILGVVTVLRGRNLDAGALCSFATCNEALTWIETRRPGVRQALRRLNARRKLNETMREERESC